MLVNSTKHEAYVGRDNAIFVAALTGQNGTRNRRDCAARSPATRKNKPNFAAGQRSAWRTGRTRPGASHLRITGKLQNKANEQVAAVLARKDENATVPRRGPVIRKNEPNFATGRRKQTRCVPPDPS